MALRQTTSAILVGAGQSTRMEGVDKIFAPVNGEPLILHSLKQFQKHPSVDHISLVLNSQNVEHGRQLIQNERWNKVHCISVGGARRQDSVRIGLSKLPQSDIIIVHDIASPLVDATLISRGLNAVQITGAATAILSIPDTLKSIGIDGHLDSIIIDRTTLRLVQTPQVFKHTVLEHAHNTVNNTVTDDTTMTELIGIRTESFEGSRLNFKVTTPEDLIIARAILQSKPQMDDANQVN